MKHLKALRPYNPLSRMKPWHKQIAKNALLSLGVVTLIAVCIWFLTPTLIVRGQAAFAPPQKRAYVIAAFYLLWLLKLLILDLDVPRPAETPATDENTQKALDHLLNRFQGALAFLQKTTIARHGRPTHLMHLPWFLLVGPESSGKTALLAHANINYILQRQHNPHQLESSDNCDWWVTRDACLIDVPGKYAHSRLWSSFLDLIKNAELQEQVGGILLTLPLPELMHTNDPKAIEALVQSIKRRLDRVQATFNRPVPCVLIITKCDLLPGFSEYFSESADDEITQAWGITLPYLKAGEKIEASFTIRFNALIKKLNQQLIWRLHQERNPLTRPPIKDFPLQIEQLKNFTLDVIKKLAKSTPSFQLHAVYLTSAMQPQTPKTPTVIIDHVNESSHAISRFNAPAAASRSYFVKQLLTFGLSIPTDTPVIRTPLNVRVKRRLAYAASAFLVVIATLQLGHDFERGLKRSQSIKQHLAAFEVTLKSFQNPNDGLIKTVELLNNLQASVKPETLSFNVKSVLTYYTHQSDQKAALIYREALQTLLLPAVKNYLAESISNPVNLSGDQLYQRFKAYLMLGDPSHFDATSFKNTFDALVTANQLPADVLQPLRYHLSLALGSTWQPIVLNNTLIQNTQHYLNSIPSDKLAYLIVKNQHVDAKDLTLNTHLFNAKKADVRIPAIFTAQAFNFIMTKATQDAAVEVSLGNWVLGNKSVPVDALALTQQLQSAYVSEYIATWETAINQLQLPTANDLPQIDALILALTANPSPLTTTLQTVHDNTYFEPIINMSPTLNAMGQINLPQLSAGLSAMHTYLQPVLKASAPRKAAYELVASRMQHAGTPDAITELRLIAGVSPDPVKSWLNQLTDRSWQLLSQTAMRYMDTSWKEQVIKPYQQTIANRYPFNHEARDEVALKQFTQFFGNPGILTNYYNQFLQPFVDTSGAEWRWKKLDSLKLPFSDESLRDIQQAVRIHHAFFPKGDAKIQVKFNLQPYQFGKEIKQVALNINNSQISDMKTKSRSHTLIWPGSNDYRMSSLDLTMKNDEMRHSDFPGTWGWLKLISQSFESPVSQKQILVNFSASKTPVKYVLSTDGQFNPLITVNLSNFKLPEQLLSSQ